MSMHRRRECVLVKISSYRELLKEVDSVAGEKFDVSVSLDVPDSQNQAPRVFAIKLGKSMGLWVAIGSSGLLNRLLSRAKRLITLLRRKR